jgi:hypothetical protein
VEGGAVTQHPLQYRRPQTGRASNMPAIVGIFAVGLATVFANDYWLRQWAGDRSWDAIKIAFMCGPGTNALIMVAALACVPLFRTKPRASAVKWYIAAAILLPLSAIPLMIFMVGIFGHGRP